MLNHDDILDSLIEGKKPTLKVVESKPKPHYTAAQVKQHQAEQQLLKLPIDERIDAIDDAYANGFTTEKGCEHVACRLGVYMGQFDPNSDYNYVRMCKRCHGKVTIDAKKRVANNTYDMHKKRGSLKASYQQHNAMNAYLVGWDSKVF